MLYFRIQGGKVTDVADETPKGVDIETVRQYHSRWEWKTFEDAKHVAELANTFAKAKDKYLAIDNGPHHGPRYDVVERPQIGQDVSYSFNGDSYPCGKIIKISTSLRRVETDDGSVFYRYKQTGGWKKKGGTWWMIHGTHNDRNPSF